MTILLLFRSRQWDNFDATPILTFPHKRGRNSLGSATGGETLDVPHKDGRDCVKCRKSQP